MTLIKTDRPRAIDRVIDFFGESPAATPAPRDPHEAAVARTVSRADAA